MAKPVSITPMSSEEALEFYRSHRGVKKERPARFRIWEPILLEMVNECTLDEINDWIAEYHQKLGYKKPAVTTVRDWVSRIRKERKRKLGQQNTELHPTPPAGSTDVDTGLRAADPSARSSKPAKQPPFHARVAEARKPQGTGSKKNTPQPADLPIAPTSDFLGDVEKIRSTIAPEHTTLESIADAISNLTVNAIYPANVIALKTLESKLADNKSELSRHEIRQYFPAIERDMRNAGFGWKPPF